MSVPQARGTRKRLVEPESEVEFEVVGDVVRARRACSQPSRGAYIVERLRGPPELEHGGIAGPHEGRAALTVLIDGDAPDAG